METDYKIKVIDKMFQILDVIETQQKPLGVNEIARMTSVNTATTFRILKNLMDHGWIYQDREEKYCAGYRLSSAYHMGSFYYLLKDSAYPIMRHLTDKEGEVVNLCIRQNDQCIILQQTRTTRFADYVVPVSSIVPLHATACGKVLMSELPDSLLSGLIGLMDFKPYTEHTICEQTALLQALQQVKQKGYATDKWESLLNTNCIGVPVRDPKGQIIAALSFSGLLGTLSEEKEFYYYQLLQNAAAEISKNAYQIA